MGTTGNIIIVTKANIEDVRDNMAGMDQALELVPGCRTWAISYGGGQRGQMTVWPDTGRSAVSHGADSVWGDWIDADSIMRPDDPYDADGYLGYYDADGVWTQED